MTTTSVRRRPKPASERQEHLDRASAEAVEHHRQQRAVVLAYPDLAKRLVAELGFDEPGQWSGYVPPRMWREVVNDSPRRAVLVEICTEAARRGAPSGAT